MLAAGESVDNRYIVEGVIGVGGTAVVYRVRHKAFDSVHALKVLSLTSPAIRRRLVREGQVQNRLRHPNVVAVTDIVPDIEGGPGLVMEYIAGPSLEQAMAQYKLSVDQALTLYQGIVAGVRNAHQHGAVHRDLKPANVLLEQTAEGFVPKVTDFGLAKLVRGEGPSVGQTRAGAAMGTPAYMAPEQIDDAGNVDERADMFSLGCLLYELVTGQRTFPGKEAFPIYLAIRAGEYTPPRLHKPDLPEAVDIAIRGCLVVDRDARIPDCDTLLAVLAGDRTWALDDLDDVFLGAPLSAEIQRTEEIENRPAMPVARRARAGATPAPVPSRSVDPGATFSTDAQPMDGSLVDSEADDDEYPPRRSALPFVLWGGASAFAMASLVLAFVTWQAVRYLSAEDPVAATATEAPADPVEAGQPAAVAEADPEPAPAPAAEEHGADDDGPHGAWPDPAPRPALPKVRPPAEPAPPAAAAGLSTVKLFSLPRTVDLLVDGKSEGRTPAKIDLGVGQHRVQLRNGEQVKDFPITVAAEGSNKWCYAFESDTLYADSCPR